MKVDPKGSFYKRRKREAQENSALEAECLLIKELYEQGTLGTILPKWDLTKLDKGVLLLDQNIEEVISFLGDGSEKILSNRSLFHQRLTERKTCEILTHWKNGQPLSPPAILVYRATNKIAIDDGRHRINAAYCLGVKTIPLILTPYVW